MSTFEIKKILTPYGTEDDVLSLNIDTSGDSYVLPELINLEAEYTFSIWHKATNDSEIVFNLFGEIITTPTNSNWQKIVKTVNVSSLENTAITISSSIGSEIYLYEAFLSQGNLDLSWYPAPEDIIDEVSSEIKQTTQAIELSVSKKMAKDRTFMGVRYIRDWLNGNANILEEGQQPLPNRWVECQVMSKETDIAAGIMPRCYDENLAEFNIENLHPEVYTNEMLLDSPNGEENVAAVNETENLEDGETADIPNIPLEEQYIELTGNYCLQIDLGSIHYDIDSIRIWHYYLNGDSYNHKLEVSSDGNEWIILYDSNESGGYAETESGKLYLFSDESIDTAFSQLKIELNDISMRVQNNAGQFSEFNASASDISSRVGTLENAKTSLEGEIQQITESFNGQIDNIKETYTTVVQTKELIANTVSDIDGKIQSQVAQTANGWKGKFAILGMMDDDEEYKKTEEYQDTYTHVSMSGDGLEVSGNKSGQRTMVTKDGFSGYYEDTEIFKLDEKGCWTGRAYINNGWETPGIKMIPIDYKVGENNVRGVVYVKTGGAS